MPSPAGWTCRLRLWTAISSAVGIQGKQYEIDEILQHTVENGLNKFLVSWKGFNPLTSASFVYEAELRRMASDLLEEYMSLHSITSDNSAYSDDEDDSTQDSAITPKQKRKRTKGQNPNVSAKQASNATNRKATGKRKAPNGNRRSKRLKATDSDKGASKDA